MIIPMQMIFIAMEINLQPLLDQPVAEMYFDTKWWNEASVTIGVRYSHLLDDDLFGGSGRNRLEIILPVNIFNQ